MTSGLSPFHLLEINLISAQDLSKVSRNMRTYAMAWVHPDRKLTTRVDTHGGTNPTWNDKFVFRVDERFLRSDTSAVMIEIYCPHWFRDIHVGTVRVLLSNLIPPQICSHNNQQNLGMRFVALQVRRPSGRPQGILNVGVTVLDSTMRSMPLYTQLSTSALGYQQLMGTEDLPRHGSSIKGSMNSGRQLRRTKSERSSLIGIDEEPTVAAAAAAVQSSSSSIINNNMKGGSGSSMIQLGPSGSMKGSEVGVGTAAAEKGVGKKGGKKIIYDKPLSIVDGGSELGLKLDVKKAKSILSCSSSVAAAPATTRNKADQRSEGGNNNNKIGVSSRNINRQKHNWLAIPENNTKGNNRNIQQDHKNKYKLGYHKDFANGSVWSESEVGPSPSEVAAAIAEDNRRFPKLDDGGSSLVNDKWSVDDDSEGLRTKLERWRTDIPVQKYYNKDDDYSSYTSSAFTSKHTRRHTTDNNNTNNNGGKFSCFGNIGGYECSIVCGKNPASPKRKVKRNTRAPSLDSWSSYL